MPISGTDVLHRAPPSTVTRGSHSIRLGGGELAPQDLTTVSAEKQQLSAPLQNFTISGSHHNISVPKKSHLSLSLRLRV